MERTNKFSPRGQKSVLLSGMRDGLPIGLGYFAVAVCSCSVVLLLEFLLIR